MYTVFMYLAQLYLFGIEELKYDSFQSKQLFLVNILLI